MSGQWPLTKGRAASHGAPADVKRSAEEALALCYREIGDDPELSLAQSAQWYCKARALDPDSLTKQQRQALQLTDDAP